MSPLVQYLLESSGNLCSKERWLIFEITIATTQLNCEKSTLKIFHLLRPWPVGEGWKISENVWQTKKSQIEFDKFLSEKFGQRQTQKLME